MTGQIITEGVSTFTPILTRLLDIVKELIPYAIYIAIGAFGVNLIYVAVKYILWNLKKETTRTFDNETIQDIKENRQEDVESRDMRTIVDKYNELYDDFEEGDLKGLGHSKMRIYNGQVQQEDYTFGGREDATTYDENNEYGRRYLVDRYKELKMFHDDKF